MVIGNGLIGRAFKSYINNDNILIFAAGVSNSREEKQSNFDREINLLNSHQNFNGLFIYFSTTSIEDVLLQDSKYIKHKRNIEQIIGNSFSNYLIVRLPNLVGDSKNKNTLVNFFKHSILNSTKFEVQKNAYRYLVEIGDVFSIVNKVIKRGGEFNKIANLITTDKVLVLEIVKRLEKELGKKANYDLIEGGSNYDIELDSIFLNIH